MGIRGSPCHPKCRLHTISWGPRARRWSRSLACSNLLRCAWNSPVDGSMEINQWCFKSPMIGYIMGDSIVLFMSLLLSIIYQLTMTKLNNLIVFIIVTVIIIIIIIIIIQNWLLFIIVILQYIFWRLLDWWIRARCFAIRIGAPQWNFWYQKKYGIINKGGGIYIYKFAQVFCE